MNQNKKTKVPATVVTQSQRDQRLADQEAEDLAREAAKKNYHFLQLDKRAMTEVRRLILSAPKAASLLILLSEHMNRQNAIVMSMSTLMDLTGWSRPTVSKSVALLREEHWIQVIKVGTANAYVINNSVFWQSARHLKITSFSATIVATSTEQDAGFSIKEKVTLKHFPFAEIKAANQAGAAVTIVGNVAPPDQSEMDM
jgi:hypothetical protein